MKSVMKLLSILLFVVPLFAHAVGEPYNQEKLNTLNMESRPTLVFVHADWCPTCRSQDKVLSELLPSKEFRAITTLKVDFDTQKSAVKELGVQYQSTLIVFKGGKEVARVTGETGRDKIAQFLRKAL